MKKFMLCFSLCVLLATTVYGGKLAFKVNLGGTYLMGGDYNKGIEGFRDYELAVLGANETFIDEMDKLGPGYQLGAEFLFNLNKSLSLGVEAGYMGASTTSHLERTWHNYKWTISPTLSAIPVTLNVHYYRSLGKKIRVHAMAGAGVFISNLTYDYDIEDTSYPYNGTWSPDAKTVFGAKAGIGFEYPLAAKVFLTFDVNGRYAKVTGFSGSWEGIYGGVPKSGDNAELYIYDFVDANGSFPIFGIYEDIPGSSHIQNPKEATFSLSGVSALVGVRIDL